MLLFTRRYYWLALCLVLAMATACTAQPSGGAAHSYDHDDHSHNDQDTHGAFVPNNGAVVRIVSPQHGATFPAGEDVLVEIEVENFVPGSDGNHWHVYVNGSSWGMVMGANRQEVLRGLPSGEHEIMVRLSIDTHEEMEEGDSITIVISE